MRYINLRFTYLLTCLQSHKVVRSWNLLLQSNSISASENARQD